MKCGSSILGESQETEEPGNLSPGCTAGGGGGAAWAQSETANNRSRESATHRWSGKQSGRGLQDSLFLVKRLLSTSGPDAVDTE